MGRPGVWRGQTDHSFFSSFVLFLTRYKKINLLYTHVDSAFGTRSAMTQTHINNDGVTPVTRFCLLLYDRGPLLALPEPPAPPRAYCAGRRGRRV